MNDRVSSKIVWVGKSTQTFKLSCDTKFVKQLMSELINFYFQEKIRREMFFMPYRKPTQVGESSRLRRSGEGSSRNSAKKLDVS